MLNMMNYRKIVSSHFFTIVLSLSLAANLIFLFQSWRGNVVVSIPDGDSLQLADGRRIRLLGLDAPERGACASDDARMTLETAAKGKHIRLKNIVTDDYGRQLAHVIVEDFPVWVSYMKWRFFTPATIRGQFPNPDPYLNRLMISHGLARFGSAKDEYYDVLKSAQSHAKRNNLGIYSQLCRQQTSDDPSCMIKGNIRGGTKTYHLPDCKNYPQTIIDTSFGDRWFCAEEEATRSGFRKASGCTQ